MKNTTKRKAAAGSIATDFSNQKNNFAGGKNELFDVSNYATDEQKIQSVLFEHLKQNQKIIKLCRCFGCNDSYAPRKMSAIPGVCRKCMKESQSKGKTAQSNFISRTVNNFQKFLRRGV